MSTKELGAPFEGVRNVLKVDKGSRFCTVEVTELYTLKRLILCYVCFLIENRMLM